MAHPRGPLSREELRSLRDGMGLPPNSPPVLRNRSRQLDRELAPTLKQIRDLPTTKERS